MLLLVLPSPGCTESLNLQQCLAMNTHSISSSGASLVAQLIENLPAVRETWAQSLGWEDPLGKGNSYPLQCSGLENSMNCIVHGVAKSQTRLSNSHFTSSSGEEAEEQRQNHQPQATPACRCIGQGSRPGSQKYLCVNVKLHQMSPVLVFKWWNCGFFLTFFKMSMSCFHS